MNNWVRSVKGIAVNTLMFIKAKNLYLIFGFAVLVGLVWIAVFFWQNLRGVGPAIKNPPEDIVKILNTTGMPLKLPPGFSISIFAKDLPGARVMAFDQEGNMWVSQTSEGIISHLIIKEGKVSLRRAAITGLRKPHGLVFNPRSPNILYFAEEDKISSVALTSAAPPRELIDLPVGGNHFTRTIGFGSDDRLYVSVGSTCNVCREADPRRAAVYSMKRDGSDFKEYARGLRNAVFFAWHPVDGRMWVTEMGRDLLGDDLPPDEINIVEAGKNYGWPICYGKNIHDDNSDKNVYFRNPCEEPFEMPSYIDIPAHSAPLGLAFIPADSGWPKDYWYNLLVAYHGSWNRSVPTGYKIVRYKLNAQGRYFGEEDFISGWLTDTGALGRPVDILVQSFDTTQDRQSGVAYISDDKAGVIYKVKYDTADAR